LERHRKVDVSEAHARVERLEPGLCRVSDDAEVADVVLTGKGQELFYETAADTVSADPWIHCHVDQLSVAKVADHEPDSNQRAVGVSRGGGTQGLAAAVVPKGFGADPPSGRTRCHLQGHDLVRVDLLFSADEKPVVCHEQMIGQTSGAGTANRREWRAASPHRSAPFLSVSGGLLLNHQRFGGRVGLDAVGIRRVEDGDVRPVIGCWEKWT
jgi:hypothetical protein